MLKKYVIEFLAAEYENKILIFDFNGIECRYSYSNILFELGFHIILYEGALEFRYLYENEIKKNEHKYAVIIERKQYVPYDILKSFHCVDIGWDSLFPNLNSEVLIEDKTLDLDLLYSAYYELYDNLSVFEETSSYVTKEVYGKNNVENYLRKMKAELLALVITKNVDYNTWIRIAAMKGKVEYLAAKVDIYIDLSFLDEEFKKFIAVGYKTISSVIKKDSPVMVTRVIDFITKKNEKIALIVLDGMSVFDFNILSSEFKGIDYQENYIYAMIPTTTAISRQSMLAGKFPVELDRPFDLSREKKEFIENAKSLGYLDRQICYTRGYDPEIGPLIKCLSIILNDIDDLVHGQMQGRLGMYNDIHLLARTDKIQNLIKRLNKMGFTIYLTSDHGNTICTGLGLVKGTGVEVETKSKRMLIFKSFANSSETVDKYNLIEYPGYYLDKQYKYYICNTGSSFDTKDSVVMTHGGISIDEVIVPFIKVKAVQNG